MGKTLEHVFHLVKVSNIDMGEWKVADTQISSCLLVTGSLCYVYIVHTLDVSHGNHDIWNILMEQPTNIILINKSESESDMTCGQVWLPILGICALHLPILSAHTQQ